jgi:hypothetical protein
MVAKSIFVMTTAVIGLCAAGQSAAAQEIVFTSTCQDVGHSAPEPLGDRDGHMISVADYSCHVDTSPMSGAVMTGTIIWEWDGPNATMLSNTGVLRMPGGTMAYSDSGGKIALTMADGKVTGFTASGVGKATLATGAAASLAGKTTNWTAKSIGSGQFTVEDRWQ